MRILTILAVATAYSVFLSTVARSETGDWTPKHDEENHSTDDKETTRGETGHWTPKYDEESHRADDKETSRGETDYSKRHSGESKSDRHEDHHAIRSERETHHHEEYKSAIVPAKLMFMADDAATCSWGSGLKCELSAQANDLRLGSTCPLPVPVPTDNYVADLRRNKYDSGLEATAKPYIEIKSTLGSTSVTTGKVTWTEYVTNPTRAQSKITFAAPGIYDLTIAASDYDRTVSCDGCVAVQDKFRPQFASGTCPVPQTSATFSTSSLMTYRNNENEYDVYVSNSNVMNNAGSGRDCSTGTSEWKIIGTADFADVEKCFSEQALSVNIRQLKLSPFGNDLQTSTDELNAKRNGLCVWSCKKSRTIKEEFIEYMCPDSTPATTCEGGTGNTCDMDVSLQCTGNDIATTTVVLKDSVQTASTGVIAALPRPPANSDPTKNVYFSLPCTGFDESNPDCQYKVKLSELLTITTTFATTFPIPASDTSTVDEFVFWRYSIDGGSWVQWDPRSDTAISFTDARSTVRVEAWSTGGIIGNPFEMDVNLYIHSELTCANFDDMWTAVGVNMDAGAYCAVEGSDFTILNLKYDYTKVLPHPDDTVTGTYTGISCDIMVKENDDAAADTTYATIASSTDQTITKNIAVEMVHDPHTSQKTVGTIKCTFTRSAHSNTMMLATATNPHSITCSHTFHVTDCDAPELYIGNQADVCADTCAGSANPGVNEQCGGTAVMSTIEATTVSTGDKACCADCNPGLECRSVGTTDIKRCETSVSPLLLAQLAAAEHKVVASQTLMALLGATSMVAVVALVVVKRRANAEAHGATSDDAYYPLLE